MDRKDRKEFERLLNIVEKRIIAGKARFGDPGLRKFYLKKLAEADG